MLRLFGGGFVAGDLARFGGSVVFVKFPRFFKFMALAGNPEQGNGH